MPNPKLDAIHRDSSTPLDTHVSLSMHPDYLLPHGDTLVAEGGSPIGEQAYKNGRLAQRALHSTLSDAEKAVKDMSVATNVANPHSPNPVLRMQVPPERRPQLHAALMERLGTAVRAYQTHLGAVEDSIAKLNAGIDRALSDPKGGTAAAATVAADIRAIVREMKPAERSVALRRAIEQDHDLEVARAVTSASPFASGLDRKTHAEIREMAERHFAPAEFAQREAAHAVLAKVTKAQELFADRFAKLLPKLEETPADKSLAKLRAGAGA